MLVQQKTSKNGLKKSLFNRRKDKPELKLSFVVAFPISVYCKNMKMGNTFFKEMFPRYWLSKEKTVKREDSEQIPHLCNFFIGHLK